MPSTTIRLATDEDLPAVQRLIETDGELHGALDLRTLSTKNGHRYALVLDHPDGSGLAAAAVITLAEEEATLGLLAVADRFRHQGIEDRMIGVAEALCDAFGCDRLVVPSAA